MAVKVAFLFFFSRCLLVRYIVPEKKFVNQTDELVHRVPNF